MITATESNGYYLDGETPNPIPVRISLLETSLRFTDISTQKSQTWEFPGIDWEHSRLLNGQLRLKFKEDDHWLVATAPALVAEIEAERKHWLKRHFWSARPDAKLALQACLITVVLFVSLWLGWPMLTKPVARMIPQATRENLADAAKGMMGMNDVCYSVEGEAAMQRLTQRLTVKRPDLRHIKIIAVQSQMINALTLANDSILVTSAILQQAASPDELAGVMAHEFGHVAHQHVLRGFLGQATVGIVLSLITGAHGMEVDYINRFAGTAHTRAFESEADQTGIALLRDARISSHGLAAFFARIAKMEGSSTRFTKYFASHPPTAEREILMRQTQIDNATPAMDLRDWRALKEMCKSKSDTGGTGIGPTYRHQEQSDEPEALPNQETETVQQPEMEETPEPYMDDDAPEPDETIMPPPDPDKPRDL